MLRGLCSVFCSVLVASMGPYPMQAAPAGSPAQSWTEDLSRGNATNVAFTGGTLRLTGPTGLLTVAVHHLPVPVAQLHTQLSAALPPGSSATVDVRALLAGQRWSEWLPERAGGPDLVTLPAPSGDVQLRVVLTGAPDPAAPRPEVRGLRVDAQPVAHMRVAAPPAEPASYRVVATREGLQGGRTANGHQISAGDLFVALPARQALADTDGSEYSVKVCARSGYCAWAPVWDTGPWNVTDDYWQAERDQFPDLPQGVPEAQAAFRHDHNGGLDGFGRKVSNAAGIDLSDGIYQTALGLSGNALVTVSYLWTGAVPLSTVHAGGTTGNGNPTNQSANQASTDSAQAAAAFPAASATRSGAGQPENKKLVVVRTQPDPDAAAAGVAADRAGVPVRCVTPNGWLRIDPDAYLPAGAVTTVTPARPC